MPVRSLRSPVLRWPDRDTVDAAVRQWAARQAEQRSGVLRVGYFGSYARGDWGVGSDVDLVVIVAQADEPFEARGATWDTTPLPVPADLIVYTANEWHVLQQRGGRFAEQLARETVWVS